MFTQNLFQAYVTKRTVRYENDSEGVAITVLYINKDSLTKPYPDKITVSVDK